eukprot:12613243-Ditylum_brightwellii.AAC.1
MGVLCHKTKKIEEAIVHYGCALQALDEDKKLLCPFVYWEHNNDKDDAIMTQKKKFHAWKVCKATCAMMILEGGKEVFAVVKMHNRFHAMLAIAQKHIQEKKEQL